MRVSGALLQAEVLKIRKRWLLYILTAVLIGGAAVQIWLLGYLSWRADDVEYQADALRSFALPYALPALLETGQSWGGVIIGILIASAVATEYSWGTVRQAVLRGQTRAEYLTVKLIGLTLMSAAILLTALAAGMLLSILATAIAGLPLSFDAPGAPNALEAIAMVLRTGYCMLPYALLAFCLTVVGRSTALGVAGTLLFVFGEAIIMGIFLGIGGAWEDVAAFLPAHNVNAIMALNRIGGEYFNTPAMRDIGLLSSELPDPWAATLLLGAYSVALLVTSYLVFQKRDMTAGAGVS